MAKSEGYMEIQKTEDKIVYTIWDKIKQKLAIPIPTTKEGSKNSLTSQSDT